MKKLLTVLVCLALALSLAACGSMGNGGTATDETLADGENGTVAGEQSMQRRVDEQVRTQMTGDKKAVSGKETRDGLTRGNFEKMLRDARVHDKDGDITDGENALHGVYGVQTVQG